MTRLVDELVRYLEAPRHQRPARPPLDFTADASVDDLLANDDLVLVPSRGIGSAGFLVNRTTWHAWELGSGRSPAEHIWAHYKGFADGQTERLNDIVILHIHDEAATQRFLRDCFTGRFYWNDLRPMLRERPARIRDVEWYFLRDDLWRAELFRWFEFRVEPASNGRSV